MSERRPIEMNARGELVLADGVDSDAVRLLIDEIQDANSERLAAVTRTHRGVAKLREMGASWTVVGVLLGLTRASAQKAFSGKTPKSYVLDPEEFATAGPQRRRSDHPGCRPDRGR